MNTHIDINKKQQLLGPMQVNIENKNVKDEISKQMNTLDEDIFLDNSYFEEKGPRQVIEESNTDKGRESLELRQKDKATWCEHNNLEETRDTESPITFS
ncbi:hypothetical protein F8M41_020862 [Gigaspora margarita]|uniref:Uncharacterized protein n=1 Tax=Gigaspora margarita TaxID=4874 RepID=A0A8H4ETS4_GIGMA|nr:hypothetical protein F8M41_020862 [Gigaspora margarita]